MKRFEPPTIEDDDDCASVTVYIPANRGPATRHNAQDILRYIVRYKTGHDGNSPTLRQIMVGCGVSSTSSVVGILRRLRRDGYIRMPDTGDARAIEVVGGRWLYGERTG